MFIMHITTYCGKLKRSRRCDFPQKAHAGPCCLFKALEQVKKAFFKLVEEIKIQKRHQTSPPLKGARPVNSYAYHY